MIAAVYVILPDAEKSILHEAAHETAYTAPLE